MVAHTHNPSNSWHGGYQEFSIAWIVQQSLSHTGEAESSEAAQAARLQAPAVSV